MHLSLDNPTFLSNTWVRGSHRAGWFVEPSGFFVIRIVYMTGAASGRMHLKIE
jgi:hypothetical protein